MSTIIYRDSEANAIFIEDANGAQFLNSLHATVDNNLVSITDTAKNFDLVSSLDHNEIVDKNGLVYGATSTEVCDALNVIFTTSGSTGQAPVITSSTTINVTEGDTINYELTADYGVGYEWNNLPSGLVTVDGNIRKLVGGSSLVGGVYSPTVKAINYFGEDSETITINVSTPAFSDTKSVKFDNLDYLDGDATEVNSVLGRASNGSGSSDAWTISMWVKPVGTENNQTLFFYGGDDLSNEGSIALRYFGHSSLQTVRLEYGSDNNYLNLLAPDDSFPRDQWTHLMVTYDGGTTGSASGSVSNYYSRFKMYANGVLKTTSNTNRNSGWNGSIKDELMRVGRRGLSTSYMRGGSRIDELALWSGDQSANISDIYNNGDTHDLSLLTTPPNHWWRMGDGDTFPTLQDSVGSLNLTMQNMTVADIVNDVP